jgi:hypothetical protein
MHALTWRDTAAIAALVLLLVAALWLGAEAAHAVAYTWQHPSLYGPESL